jgi:hypothetical protein
LCSKNMVNTLKFAFATYFFHNEANFICNLHLWIFICTLNIFYLKVFFFPSLFLSRKIIKIKIWKMYFIFFAIFFFSVTFAAYKKGDRKISSRSHIFLLIMNFAEIARLLCLC